MAAMPAPPPLQSQMFHSKLVRRLGMIIDESSLDIPAFKRRNAEQAAGPTRIGQEGLETDDKLDIPAFLRKQID